ncbi:MAG: hypothetical protein K2L49_03425 [Muribaculaceae bacterium]|nr:hypothetical protein [Muribaculaceae bacterium]
MKTTWLISLFSVAFIAVIGCQSPKSPLPAPGTGIDVADVDSLGIAVSAGQQREYSFTDKKSAFWYGMTHTDDWNNHYAGWNIAKRRLLSDYTLYDSNGDTLRRNTAQVTVYPYKLHRRYTDGTTEEFYMFDNIEALLVRIDNTPGDSVSISLSQRLLSNGRADSTGVSFTPAESPSGTITLMPFADTGFRWTGKQLISPQQSNGFIIVYSESGNTDSIAGLFRATWDKLLQERVTRMNDIVRYYNPIHSNLDTLDRAMAWITLTTDELITRQQGNGIYAGLPWFNEYWGRDMFISLPGAALCTGQWLAAKSILWDFAQFQDTVASSPTRGRIPNRANPDGIIYNTADGTPRFVIDIYEYLNYTADTEFLASIYPAVARSVDSALQLRTDTAGYLVHADADTWMDAKRQGLYPCSPRGNRANDIQALWYEQLKYAAAMATIMGQDSDAKRWNAAADRVIRSFRRDFIDPDTGHIHDHLNSDGSADRQLRPNELYAYGLLPNSGMTDTITRDIWQRLVYPWGVASLDQDDPQFHPYHENWHHYHKDDAYHNGTVWLWLNGMAMQRMIEAGQPDVAWQLFSRMNRQALVEGAIGSLSENADAWPAASGGRGRISGTFLQAWSNAEHLRVWYQQFLGLRPQLLDERVTIAPRLPEAIDFIQYSQLLAHGRIEGAFAREAETRVYAYRFVNMSATVTFDIEQYKDISVDITPGMTITLAARGDRLHATAINDRGTRLFEIEQKLDPEKVERQLRSDSIYDTVRFAQPKMRTDLPTLSRYFNPPLDYSSTE